MRVALISDLHGNLVALDAVRADARRLGVDAVVCLGDVATLGPHPREVLAAVDELGTPTILGNHDEFLLEPALIARYTEAPIIHDAVAAARSRARSSSTTRLVIATSAPRSW